MWATVKSLVISSNAPVLHVIYLLSELTEGESECTCFEQFELYHLISLLNLDIRQNKNNQNEAVLM